MYSFMYNSKLFLPSTAAFQFSVLSRSLTVKLVLYFPLFASLISGSIYTYKYTYEKSLHPHLFSPSQINTLYTTAKYL